MTRGAQRMARWLVWTALCQDSMRGYRCGRCRGFLVISWDPEPPNRWRHGWSIWTRCLNCGAQTCNWCQPIEMRAPFVPPMAWTSIEQEIRQAQREEAR